MNNAKDDYIDNLVFSFINPSEKKSFFLFAGAGSGKTRTLVNVLEKFRDDIGYDYIVKNKKIAVITYTNAASEEITRRVKSNTLFSISTIHTFSWQLIKNFSVNIRDFLIKQLEEKILVLQTEQENAKNKSTKKYITNEQKIERYKNRLTLLPTINQFIYDPAGINSESNALSHNEVIEIATTFINQKETMQKVIISKYPIIFIDECQDTNEHVLDAFLHLENKYRGEISIGMFGDTMQRIYNDGKSNLVGAIPSNWEQPKKVMNHRSEKRIIDLINKVRFDVDGLKQEPREDKQNGFVRIFIIPEDNINIQQKFKEKMFSLTGDDGWNTESYTTLVLEHHMAAKRANFFNFFEPLYAVDDFKTGLLDGTIDFLRFFMRNVVPIINAVRDNNDFQLAYSLKKLYLNKGALTIKELDNMKLFAKTISGIILRENALIKEIMKVFAAENNIEMPEIFKLLFASADISGNSDFGDERLDSLDKAMNANINELINYSNYVNKLARFETHQGVKGLEYDRVVVIMDDEEAKGFMFSYDKLFGIKEKTKTDLENEAAGKDTSISRTKRLFYVACSRAKKSLCLLAFSKDASRLYDNLKNTGWFADDEIEILD